MEENAAAAAVAAVQKKATAGKGEPVEETEIASFCIHHDDDDEEEATLALSLAMTEKELRVHNAYLQFLEARSELEDVNREIQMLEKGDSSHAKDEAIGCDGVGEKAANPYGGLGVPE